MGSAGGGSSPGSATYSPLRASAPPPGSGGRAPLRPGRWQTRVRPRMAAALRRPRARAADGCPRFLREPDVRPRPWDWEVFSSPRIKGPTWSSLQSQCKPGSGARVGSGGELKPHPLACPPHTCAASDTPADASQAPLHSKPCPPPPELPSPPCGGRQAPCSPAQERSGPGTGQPWPRAGAGQDGRQGAGGGGHKTRLSPAASSESPVTCLWSRPRGPGTVTLRCERRRQQALCAVSGGAPEAVLKSRSWGCYGPDILQF